MLLRSSSTPILNSWIPHAKESSPESETILHIPRTRSITLTSPSASSLSSVDDSSKKKITRALSETDLRDLSVPKKKPIAANLNGLSLVEEQEVDSYSSAASLNRLFSSSGLDEGCAVTVNGADMMTQFVGGGAGSGGGGICGGGGGRGGSDGGDGGGDFEYSNRGINSTDVYYQKMIEANPGNPLLLSNYAKFLKEVRGDLVKAEQYCGRAILANPGEASVLSLYADIIWQQHKDASRAESYFGQAVQAAPDDCYVLASYARFLWDAEEEEEEEEERSINTKTSTPSPMRGARPPLPPPLAATS